ncbi:MAG: 23S rRNA (pseudouridine(1915)-N(3))-methyltransferase RlmH [Methyloceanibacter sp.]|jgi:23S rRNA (pseudouridine1915-N3)-methyltransferase
MRLLIAAVGKLKQGPERDLYAHYLGRAEALGRSLSLSPVASLEFSESRASSAGARSADEAKALLAKVPSGHRVICLDPAGKMLSSEAFAQTLAKFRDNGTAGLTFLIGGADGLGQNARDKANLLLSLGPMVLPHGLARIVLAEQLYRAMTILAGHPYHRG